MKPQRAQRIHKEHGEHYKGSLNIWKSLSGKLRTTKMKDLERIQQIEKTFGYKLKKVEPENIAHTV